jgi:hypothetical protein
VNKSEITSTYLFPFFDIGRGPNISIATLSMGSSTMNWPFEEKKRPKWNDISEKSATVKTLWRQWDRLKIHGGMLYRNCVMNKFENHLQLINPTLKKEEAIKHFHDIPSAGHLGVDKTIDRKSAIFANPLTNRL